MKSLVAILALLGVVSCSKLGSKMKTIQNLAELQSTSAEAHSCSYTIERIKQSPADYQSILGSGKLFTDSQFPHGPLALHWSDRPQSRGTLRWVANSLPWARGSESFPDAPLFPAEVSPYGIKQGAVNDCYFLTAASALAEKGQRIKEIFINTEDPAEGLIAVKLYVKGKPTIVIVDDYLAFMNGKLFAHRIGNDGSLWAAYLEKAYSKIIGNYEYANFGWQNEAFRILTGAPSYFYMVQNDLEGDAETIWDIIREADKNSYLIGANNQRSRLGLRGNHAYSVLGAYELKDSQGNVQHKLYQMRNPYSTD